MKMVGDDYTSKELKENWSEFYKLSNELYHSDKNWKPLSRKDKMKDLYWKDEMYAWIFPKDEPRLSTAVAFYTGSILDVVEYTDEETKMLVYSQGYWRSVGA
tara:strand:- start:306 stop:611 length:306 start_codon:yes stop_codon:yes gene_type:complete